MPYQEEMISLRHNYPERITSNPRNLDRRIEDNTWKLTTLCLPYVKELTERIQKICNPYTFFSLKIINPQNINKNILEISDQNHINIEVTLLYFSTNQLKTQNKNIRENSAQKLINRKIFRLQNK